ncbi:hypothetical protein GFS31_12370 [Leptolyngbya sp. BL0902]|nr:hypothetical protein GFS31_12370 [Leptolyngbya sp. BL0902]
MQVCHEFAPLEHQISPTPYLPPPPSPDHKLALLAQRFWRL